MAASTVADHRGQFDQLGGRVEREGLGRHMEALDGLLGGLGGLSLRGAHHHSEQRLEAALSSFAAGSLPSPSAAADALRAMNGSSHDLAVWCDAERRGAAEPWVEALAARAQEFRAQLHRFRWPRCTCDVDRCAEHRQQLAAWQEQGAGVAAPVLTAAESGARIATIERRYHDGGLSETDVLGLLGQLVGCREWGQPINDAESARVHAVLALARPQLLELARQLHSHSMPACANWPECEHAPLLLPAPPTPAAIRPPPPTAEQQQARQVEQQLGGLSLLGLGGAGGEFGQPEPEMWRDLPEAQIRRGGVVAGSAPATAAVAPEPVRAAPHRGDWCKPDTSTFPEEATAAAAAAPRAGFAAVEVNLAQTMMEDERPICCFSQRPEGCPEQQQPSCTHGRHCGGGGQAVQSLLREGGCHLGLQCPHHVAIATLLYKSLGAELGYSRAEVRLRPILHSLGPL